MPEWLSRIRRYDGQSGEDGRWESTNPEIRIRARAFAESTILRQCINWLEQLDQWEMVIVNLRPDADEETEFVSFDRQRALKVLKRIAADLEDLALRSSQEMNCGVSPGDDLDAMSRHRRPLAEPPPKSLSHREQRAASRAKLELPPK